MLDKDFQKNLQKLMKNPPAKLMQHIQDNFTNEKGQLKRKALMKFLEDPEAAAPFFDEDESSEKQASSYSSDKDTAKKMFVKYQKNNPGTQKSWEDFYRPPEKDTSSQEGGGGGAMDAFNAAPPELKEDTQKEVSSTIASNPPKAKKMKNKMKKIFAKATQYKNKGERENAYKTSVGLTASAGATHLALTAMAKSKKLNDFAIKNPKAATAIMVGALAATAVAAFKASKPFADKSWDYVDKANEANGGDPFTYWEDSHKDIDKAEADEDVKQSKLAMTVAERFINRSAYDPSGFGAGRMLSLKDKFRRIYTELRFIAMKTIAFLEGLRDRAKPMQFQYDLDTSKLISRINDTIDNMKRYLKALNTGMDNMRVAVSFDQFKDFLGKHMGKIIAGLGALGSFFLLSKNYLQYPLKEEAFDELNEMQKRIDQLLNVPAKLHETSEILVASIPPSKELKNIPRDIKKEISSIDKDAKLLYELTDPWGELASSFLDVMAEVKRLKQQTKLYT